MWQATFQAVMKEQYEKEWGDSGKKREGTLVGVLSRGGLQAWPFRQPFTTGMYSTLHFLLCKMEQSEEEEEQSLGW